MANINEIKKLYKSLLNLKNIKNPDDPNTVVDFSLIPENEFIKKIESKDGRDKFFKRYWTPLKNAGFSLGKYADFEKRYGGTVNTGQNIKKLLSIDSELQATTSPNQALKVYKGQGGDRIRIFFNDGRFVSRTNLNNINDKTGETSGIWYFVGNDNYQVKLYGENTRIIDFKKGNNVVKVSDNPFTPPAPQTQGSSPKPILQKLMKIDEYIKKTTSPDQVVRRLDNDAKEIFIFYSDGNFRLRYSSINNKNKEYRGTWKLIGDNDYQIYTDDGDVYTRSKNGWKNNETTPSSGTSGKTWNEVSFTLDDVLKGKAVLKRGDKGPAVVELQKLMIKMNFSKVSKSGEPDGYFGKLTELSIRQFQNEMPYGEQDGKVGKKTLSRMLYVYNYDPDKEVDDVETPKTQADFLPKDIPSDALNPQLPPEELQENIKKIVSKILKEHKD